MSRIVWGALGAVFLAACGGAAPESPRQPTPAPPASSAPRAEIDPATFCPDWCSATSERCLVRARREAETKEGHALTEEETKSVELFCGVTKARCKRKCGEEGAAGYAAANAPQPPAPCGGKKLRVKFYDVGQALSALVELPDGRRILVDTGEQPTRAGCGAPCKAWSAHLLSGLAKDVANRKLDVVWTTHQHSDHAGNADTILKTFTVGAYVDNGTNLEDDKTKPGPVLRARQAAQARGTKIVVIDPEHTESPIAASADVRVTPIVPTTWPANCEKHPNDCSLGLRIDYCKSSVLFTGDAEAKEEALWNTEPATLLQAGHHGSDTSSSEAFANAVHPAWVVISSGKKDEGTNRTYCHPRRATVERLAALAGGTTKRSMQVFEGTSCKDADAKDWTTIDVSDRVFSTARDGDVVLITTGDGTFAKE